MIRKRDGWRGWNGAVRAAVLSALAVIAVACAEMETTQGLQQHVQEQQVTYTCGRCGGTYMQPQNCPKCGLELTPRGGTPQWTGPSKGK
ncbi:MAG: hypothetical protein HYY16_11850 [Planctomycetes bacterium]|nr:hypothetical protein [Planctomycetota bacterium]